ncbi:hypothetical protein [Haliscomenobacter hydrossis]|uniref:Uncharacterized protein n=1 Tax=Haliscomenobacter hydrossis (strain ATCC 27775 / DSM 1100 / LMG 10767 / O) TaxID=760192 RepID=F4KZ71_HALH1|nr:hypothetical protein [Haliscomenobacter hydrossis]AEE53725.1 hypothetical protein Halhy_5902 [Haliscomenobacter hydrossis DSM 1100]
MPLTDPVVISGNISGAYAMKFNVAGVGIVDLSELLQYAITTAESGGGSAGSTVYTNGGWLIKGTVGITVDSPGAGLYNVTVPAGGILESMQSNFDDAETDFTEDGNIILTVDWNTADFNTSWTNALVPDIKIIDPAAIQREPGDVTVTVEHVPILGTTITSINGINGVGVPCRIKAIF